ncbi:MAG: diguanylate cyclase [Pseudomonadota bacterium]
MVRTFFHPRWGLQTRLSAGVMAIVFVATLLIATAALQVVKHNMQVSVTDDQYERVTAIADTIDQKFVSRRILLRTLADSVEAMRLQGPEQLQDFVDQHGSLKRVFDNVAFVDLRGDLVASLNGIGQIGRLNVADRDYFTATVGTMGGVVSQPYRSRLSGVAQVAITEPVMDVHGVVRWVIIAAINLPQRNFLGELADQKFGKTGYLFILNTNGTMVDHPNKARILQPFGSDGGPGSGANVQLALAGAEGTVEGVNRSGVPGLFSFKRLRQTNWIVGTFYPRAEAFAQVDAVERWAWLGAVVLALLAGTLAMVLMRRQLAPITVLHRHMLAVRDNPDHVPAEQEYPADEIGDLARTFATLMAQRQAATAELLAKERFLRTLTDNIPAMVSHIDSALRYTFANAHLRNLHGQGDLVGRLMPEVRGADYPLVEPYIRKAMAGEIVTVQKAGDPGLGLDDRTFKASYIPDMDADGTVQGLFAMTFDVSKEVNARRALAEQEKRLRAITDNLPALIAYIDREEHFLFANETYRSWLGRDPASLIGRRVGDLMRPELYALRKHYIARALAGQRVEFESSGAPMGVPRTTHSIYIPDLAADGSVPGIYMLSVDVTDLKRVQSQLSDLARVDALTRLPNRLAFGEILPQALARAARAGTALALIFLDIDKFKAINDTLGHAGGDVVLAEFAARLRAAVRSTDTVARLAGDEFLVLLEPVATREMASEVAQKICEQIAGTPFDVEGQPVAVSTSIGIAWHAAGAPPVTGPALVARADAALYAAKTKGRNRYEFAV